MQQDTIISLQQLGGFFEDTLLHAEVPVRTGGEAGSPVPYTLRNDSVFTSMLLFCFVAYVVSVSRSGKFVLQQLKNLFYMHHDEEMNETTGELHFQLFLVGLTALMISIQCFQYVVDVLEATLWLNNDFLLVLVMFGCIIGYFTFRALAYTLVNNVFFDGRRNFLWMKNLLFFTAMEGILLLPAVLVQVYFDVEMEKMFYYLGFIFILIKILTFYKCNDIFFRRNDFYLQTFLYFCTLEAVPLLAFVGGMWVLVNSMMVNF